MKSQMSLSRIAKNAAFAFGLCTLAPLAMAATGADNGTDFKSTLENAAWFLGEKTVRYCLEIDEAKLGVTESDASAAVSDALAQWRTYLSRRPEMEEDNVAVIAKRFEREPCQDKTDLVFYLGTENARVDKAKRRLTAPLALAEREAYDIKSGWGKGFVWVAPTGTHGINWSSPQKLKTVLLHELGHVLGNGHVPNTIMRPDLIAFLQNDFMNKSYMGKIDHLAQLFRPSQGVTKFTDALLEPFFIGLWYSMRSGFKTLTGIAISEEDEQYLNVRFAINRTESLGTSARLDYWFKGQRSSFNIKVTEPWGFAVAQHPGAVFKRAFIDPRSGAQAVRSFERLAGVSFTGTITGKDGQEHPVIVTENMAYYGAGLLIELLKGSQRELLLFGQKDPASE